MKNPTSYIWRKKYKDGYIITRNIDGTYILEHRLVMEKYLGRKLDKKEYVHHIDHNRENNNIENLIVCKSEMEHLVADNIMYKYKEWKSEYIINEKREFILRV